MRIPCSSDLFSALFLGSSQNLRNNHERGWTLCRFGCPAANGFLRSKHPRFHRDSPNFKFRGLAVPGFIHRCCTAPPDPRRWSRSLPCRKASMQITREEKGKIFLQLELPACRKVSMQITREEKCPQGVWIGVALTFGWLLGLAKIGHPPLHRLARHIHSRVSCKGTRWGKTIFYRIFIAICAQALATARLTARWRRRASLRRRYRKSITWIPDPIGHSSWERGARSDRAPQYHLS